MAALPLGPLRSRVLLLVALVVFALSAPGFIAAFLWARCGWRGCLDVTRLADLAMAERLLDEGDAVAALRHTKRAQERIAGHPTPQPVWLGMLAGRLIDCGGDLRLADLVRGPR